MRNYCARGSHEKGEALGKTFWCWLGAAAAVRAQLKSPFTCLAEPALEAAPPAFIARQLWPFPGGPFYWSELT